MFVLELLVKFIHLNNYNFSQLNKISVFVSLSVMNCVLFSIEFELKVQVQGAMKLKYAVLHI